MIFLFELMPHYRFVKCAYDCSSICIHVYVCVCANAWKV